MNESEIKKFFLDKGAMLEGHFQLTSGRHSDLYLQCALILQYPDLAEKLGESLVARVREENAGIPVRVDAVCSPALGGIVLGHVVARAMRARAIFAEREPGAGLLRLRRGFSIRPGESILAVEDVITTGGSLREIVTLVNNSGAKLIGVASVAERSAVPVHFGTTKTVLLKIPLKDYLPTECPLCQKGIPLVKPGSRPEKVDAA
ncbi:MAG: orotate phosphoribosyltransferase [Elusimicrobia bacterium]|nr:orotate phosphoribosyltransferase [Elusimicrobiota bacterium]